MSLGQRVKDYLGKKFLLQYKSPAYWDRPLERAKFLGIPDGGKQHVYENVRVARGYPHLEFDTAYYTRLNQVPPAVERGRADEPALLIDGRTTVPTHFPIQHWRREPEIIKAQLEKFEKYGYVQMGATRFFDKYEGDFVVFGTDSDYYYFHN